MPLVLDSIKIETLKLRRSSPDLRSIHCSKNLDMRMLAFGERRNMRKLWQRVHKMNKASINFIFNNKIMLLHTILQVLALKARFCIEPTIQGKLFVFYKTMGQFLKSPNHWRKATKLGLQHRYVDVLDFTFWKYAFGVYSFLLRL